MVRRMAFILLALALLLAACGGGEEGGAGGGSRGEALFEQTTLGSNAAPGCATCHSRVPGQTLVGPFMAGVGTRAGSEVAGQTAEDYLHEAIVDPDAHVVEGFSPRIMYANYAKDLTDEQIDDLVAYLLTLK